MPMDQAGQGGAQGPLAPNWACLCTANVLVKVKHFELYNFIPSCFSTEVWSLQSTEPFECFFGMVSLAEYAHNNILTCKIHNGVMDVDKKKKQEILFT